MTIGQEAVPGRNQRIQRRACSPYPIVYADVLRVAGVVHKRTAGNGQGLIVAGDHTAYAGCHVVCHVRAETGGNAPGPNRAPPGGNLDGFAGVLNHRKVVGPRNFGNTGHIGGEPQQVNGQNSNHVGRERFKPARVQVEGSGLNVNKRWLQLVVQDSGYGGRKSGCGYGHPSTIRPAVHLFQGGKHQV